MMNHHTSSFFFTPEAEVLTNGAELINLREERPLIIVQPNK